MSAPKTSARNFGPSFGCDLIVLGDRITPRPLEHAVVYLVALVGLVLARRNIPHSRAYLQAVTGRSLNTAALLSLIGRGAMGWGGLLADARHADTRNHLLETLGRTA